MESVFNRVAGLMACKFIEKRLQYRCFRVNSARFLRFFYRTPLVAASGFNEITGKQQENLI